VHGQQGECYTNNHEIDVLLGFLLTFVDLILLFYHQLAFRLNPAFNCENQFNIQVCLNEKHQVIVQDYHQYVQIGVNVIDIINEQASSWVVD
jgi:hypothetical protein